MKYKKILIGVVVIVLISIAFSIYHKSPKCSNINVEEIVSYKQASQIVRDYNTKRDYFDYGIVFIDVELHSGQLYYLFKTVEVHETHNVTTGYYAVDMTSAYLYKNTLEEFSKWQLIDKKE